MPFTEDVLPHFSKSGKKGSFHLSLYAAFFFFFLGLIVSLQLFRGDLEALRRENQTLFNGAVTLTRKLGFPDIILPGRCDTCLTCMFVNAY